LRGLTDGQIVASLMKANGWFRCAALTATAAFFWAIVLSASPGLHQRIHPDAHQLDHNCIATLVAHGQYQQSTSTPLVVVQIPRAQPAAIPTAPSTEVPSLFLTARIFEHAPPPELLAS
jgi:hypothetical protein